MGYPPLGGNAVTTPEPVSWLAIEVIEARVKEITQANGYRTDLGNGLILKDRRQIPQGIDEPGAQSAYTVIAASSFRFLQDKSGNRQRNEDMDVLLEFGIPLDSEGEAEREVHRARADLIKALLLPLRGGPAGLRILLAPDSYIGDAPDGSNYLIAQVSARAGLTEIISPAN